MLGSAKTLLQVAALPYVWTDDGPEVALVTSRERRRWIIPKGWPERDCSLKAAAAQEALEEAGLEGDIAAEPIGSFNYRKGLDRGYTVTCRAFVFPMFVTLQRLRWKERKQRRLIWMPLAEAAKRVDDKGLARLLADLATAPERLSASLSETRTGAS